MKYYKTTPRELRDSGQESFYKFLSDELHILSKKTQLYINATHLQITRACYTSLSKNDLLLVIFI